MHIRLFLDTEWANDASRELVSLALVSQDTAHRFYAERDPLPGAPSSFVRSVVYPLLERGDFAVIDAEFTRQLRAFLCQFSEPPLVLYDAQLDVRLLTHALDGFGRAGDYGPMPNFQPILITFGDVLANIETYFDLYPESKARRHHAAVDAEALRWAFDQAMRGSRL